MLFNVLYIMNYKKKKKIKAEILYYTGYQLEHTINMINLMVNNFDVSKCSYNEINKIINLADIYLNSSSHLIKF